MAVTEDEMMEQYAEWVSISVDESAFGGAAGSGSREFQAMLRQHQPNGEGKYRWTTTQGF